jgi:ADP-heptose:LPS heptosyltransferase
MKVLFVSLMRIGDFLMHVKIADSYRKKHTEVEIHFLVNDIIGVEFEKIFPFIFFHRFPRFKYQKMINSFETPLMYPFWDLKKNIKALFACGYDEIIDLTYQQISTQFLNMIPAPRKRGVFSWEPFITSDNYIKKFINKMHEPTSKVHYLEHLKKIAGVDLELYSSSGDKTSKLVLFQISTSDAKKNYDLVKWKRIIDKLSDQFSDYCFKIICSHEEFLAYKTFFNVSQLESGDFLNAYELLKQASLLVTLDTALKHLATWTKTSTLELSSGRSHPFKTAAFQAGNYILSAEMNCRPCQHSLDCPYNRNFCQDSIAENKIVNFVSEWIQNQTVSEFSFRTLNQGSRFRMEANCNLSRGEEWNEISM